MNDGSEKTFQEDAASMNSGSRTATASHTPGPWFVGATVSGSGIAQHVTTVSAALVASVGDHDARCAGLHKMYASPNYNNDFTRFEVMNANARLIAAAPDMLAALRLIVAFADDDDTNDTDHRQEAVNVARLAIAKATGATP